MNPYKSAQENSITHWTRVDLLIAIYNKAISHIEQMSAASDEATATSERLKAVRLVAHLLAGLNKEHGEIPQRIEQLLEFVSHSLSEASPASAANAMKVLVTLREAFEGIREQAVEMESNGELPALNDQSIVECLV